MPFSPVLLLLQVPNKFYSTSPHAPYKISYKWGTNVSIKMQLRESLCCFFPFMTHHHSTAAVPGMFSSLGWELGCLGLVCRSTRPQTSHPSADPRKASFPVAPSFLSCQTSQGCVDGTGARRGHTVVPTFPVPSSGTHTPLHQCPAQGQSEL